MSNNAKRWRLLLYGAPKTGKTSLAETAPGPRLFIDAEGGTDWLASRTVAWDPKSAPPKDLDENDTVVVHVKDWDEVELVNSWLQRGEHVFNSVVLDSITELQKLCKRAVSSSGMELRDWGVLYDRMDPVLREIRDLTKHDTNPVWCVVITALSNEKDGVMQPDIQGSMARSLAGQIDTIGYLQPGTMNSDGQVGRELVVDPKSSLYAGDRTKVIRRAFKGKVPIHLDEATDTLSWNLAELVAFMNEEST